MKKEIAKMHTTICSHDIQYSWADGKKRKLDGCDIVFIQLSLKEDHASGKLLRQNKKTKKEHRGWWSITQSL